MLEGEEGVRADDDYAKGETSHAEYSCSCLIRDEVGVALGVGCHRFRPSWFCLTRMCFLSGMERCLAAPFPPRRAREHRR